MYISLSLYLCMYVCMYEYILPQRSWDYSQERVGRFQIFKRKATSETLKGEFLNVRIFVSRMKMYVCMQYINYLFYLFLLYICVCMNEFLYICAYVCVYVCMYICMYVCMYRK